MTRILNALLAYYGFTIVSLYTLINIQSVCVFPYSVEVDKLSLVMSTAIQGAVVSSESLPSSVEVVGHHVDEVQRPGDARTNYNH